MKRNQRIKLLIPLVLIAGILFYCWGTILFTDIIGTWRHFLALAIFLILIILFFTKFNLAVLATGLFLLAGTINLLAITPSITTNSYGLRIGSFNISTPSIQLPFFGLFILYFILNGGRLEMLFRRNRRLQ